MPERPRSHELERESRNKFEAAIITNHWLVRDVDGAGDYGIDQEVEIFNDQRTTGLTFRVQVKGTDAPDKIGPFRDISLEHFDYWNSLGTPVLLVLWVASTDQVYGRWVHSYDHGLNPRGKKTRRVRFNESDLLNTQLDRLQEEVELFRALDSGWLPRPIPIQITIDSIARSKFIFQIRSFLGESGLRSRVRVASLDEEGPFVSASVTDTSIRVALPANARSITLHFPLGGYLKDDAWPMIFRDITIGTGILAAKLGATADAVALIESGDPGCFMTEEFVNADVICFTLVRELRPSFAVGKVVQRLAVGEIDDDVYSLYFDTVLQMLDLVDKVEFKTLRKAMGSRSRLDETSGDRMRAARLAHNAAALCKRRGRFELVDELSDRAIALDPDGYGQRGDVAILRGNTAWNLDDVAGALIWYERARALGVEFSEIGAPLSDTYMRLGKYRAAADLLDAWIGEAATDVDPRSILRRIILAEILEGLEIDEQERNELSAAETEEVGDGDDQAVTALLRSTDALDSRLWAKLGANGDGAPISLMGKYAISAFFSNHGLAWLLLLMVAYEQEVDEWILNTLIQGAVASSEFVDVVEEIKENLDIPEVASFLELLSKLALDYDPSSRESRLINLTNEDNKVRLTVEVSMDGEVVNMKSYEDNDDEGDVAANENASE